MNHHNSDGFDEVVQGFNESPYQPGYTDSNPYGIPANSIPTKPGLTKRGKVAIAIGTAALATTGLVFWQHNSAAEAASQVKQQEIQLENKKLDLEMLKEMNQASAANEKSQKGQDDERQKQIAACVNADKGLVGKQLGVTYSSVLKDCRDQYPTGSDMQNTASASAAGSSGGGVNQGVLIGGGVIVLGLIFAAKKATRPASA